MIHVNPEADPVFNSLSATTASCGGDTTSTLHYDNNAGGICRISGDVPSHLSAATTACGENITESWDYTTNCNYAIHAERVISMSPAAAPSFDAVSAPTASCGGATTSTLHYDNNAGGICRISGDVPSHLSAATTACGENITESWDATDVCGHALHSERIISVSPATLPTMTAPLDTTISCGPLPAASKRSFTNGLSGVCLI